MPLIVPYLEVNEINKQKFLAELGKLLTFMYEEDRQTALAMYGRMFDDAEDEQQLMQLLVSPTKQAVIIARAYDSKLRKLQVEAQSRAEDEQPEAAPRFILAIDEIYQKVHRREPEASEVMEDQFSLFEGDSHPIKDEEYVTFPAADEPAAPEEVSGETAEEAQPAEEETASDGTAQGDTVEEFLEDFSIRNDELSPEDQVPQAEAVQPDEPAQEAAPVHDSAATEEPLLRLDGEGEEEDDDEDGEPGAAPLPEARRRAKPFLLFLYILIAIPVTLCGVVLLLIPTLLSLALAVAVIASGAFVLVSAFSGLPVFADVMIVLGTAIIVLALGMLFLWLFIWFIGGAIGGLIRGVLNLGRRWCYEEVPV